MPTSWKRADDNALRAHLQEALAERMARGHAGDWSYSDYEVEAIQEELRERQVATFSSRHDLALERPPLCLASPEAVSANTRLPPSPESSPSHDEWVKPALRLRSVALSGHAKRWEPMPERRAGRGPDAQQVKHAGRH